METMSKNLCCLCLCVRDKERVGVSVSEKESGCESPVYHSSPSFPQRVTIRQPHGNNVNMSWTSSSR